MLEYLVLETSWFLGSTYVVFAKQLHPHHGEDEDDNTQHERQVTQRAHSPAHDRYKQIQRGPRFRQFEHSEQPEGTQHWQTLHTLKTELQQGERDDDKVEDVPSLLEVVLGTHRDQLHGRLNHERRCKELHTNIEITNSYKTTSKIL